MDFMDERTREFQDVIKLINAEADGLGYKTGLDWAKNAGVLGASDAGSYEGAHYLRNAVAHGRAMDVRVTQETLDFVNAVLLTIQATTQASNASKSRRSFFKKLFGNKKDDLPDAQEALDVDDRTHEFLNVIELINAEAGGLGYTNGRDWAEKAGVLGAGDVSNYKSAHYLRLATMHGRAKDVHVTQETLDFVQDILQAIQEAGQTADTSKPRTSFSRKLFNKKKADLPVAEPAEVSRKPEPNPEPKPGTLEWYLQAADKGDASAQCELGRRYLSGEGVAEDKAEALKWYCKAAQLGHAKSQFVLGTWYDNGTGVPQNREEAAKWYLQAAEQGYADAQYSLACLYERMGGPNLADAVKWYRLVAERGVPEAQYALGQYYMGGYVTGKADHKEARKWYEKAAAQGNADAEYMLAVFYANGVITGRRDKIAACEWYKRAAEHGNANASYKLASDYCCGLDYYRMAAEQGHTEAQLLLGELYENGIRFTTYKSGVRSSYLTVSTNFTTDKAEALKWYDRMAGQNVTADKSEALKWYCMAGENGTADLQYKLATWYECGIGTSPDWNEARNWYEKAAEQGHTQAQIVLAQLHSEGDMHDEKESQKWLIKAAKQGDRTALDLLADDETDEDALDGDDTLEERYVAEARTGAPGAMYELGYNYLYGCGGVRKNLEKAVQWLTVAAERGDGDAMYELGCCYENGWGVDQDEDEARQWYWEAFVQGSDEAEMRLKELREEEDDED